MSCIRTVPNEQGQHTEYGAAYDSQDGDSAGTELTVQPEVAKLLHALQLSGPKARRTGSIPDIPHITGPVCKRVADVEADGLQANLEVSLGRKPVVDPRLMAATRALCVRSVDELRGLKLQRLADFGGKPVLPPASEVRNHARHLTCRMPNMDIKRAAMMYSN